MHCEPDERHQRITFTVRVLTPEDEPFLREALYHALHVPAGVAPLDPDVVLRPELARYVSGWMRPGDSGVIAEETRVPIGAAWLRRWPGPERGYGYVDENTPELSMAVVPHWRGMGVGTAMLRQVLAMAQREFGAVSLSVSLDNPARRLYEREGFVVFAEVGAASVTMVRHFGSHI